MTSMGKKINKLNFPQKVEFSDSVLKILEEETFCNTKAKIDFLKTWMMWSSTLLNLCQLCKSVQSSVKFLHQKWKEDQGFLGWEKDRLSRQYFRENGDKKGKFTSFLICLWVLLQLRNESYVRILAWKTSHEPLNIN